MASTSCCATYERFVDFSAEGHCSATRTSSLNDTLVICCSTVLFWLVRLRAASSTPRRCLMRAELPAIAGGFSIQHMFGTGSHSRSIEMKILAIPANYNAVANGSLAAHETQQMPPTGGGRETRRGKKVRKLKRL